MLHGTELASAPDMSALSPVAANHYTESHESGIRGLGVPPLSIGPQEGPLAHSLIFSLRRVQLALLRGGLRGLSEGRVGPAEFGVLSLCAAHPGIAQVQIAAALDVDKASVVGLVDRLEALGWLIRRRSVKDRRRHGLHLTGEGVRALQQLQQQASEVEARVRARFSDTEWQQLIGFLARAGS